MKLSNQEKKELRFIIEKIGHLLIALLLFIVMGVLIYVKYS